MQFHEALNRVLNHVIKSGDGLVEPIYAACQALLGCGKQAHFQLFAPKDAAL
jgi:hypothetical protein